MKVESISKEVADHLVKKITDAYFLGSSNIQPIMRSKSIYDDSVSVNKSLFFRISEQRQVNALIDDKLEDLANNRVRKRRKLYSDLITILPNLSPKKRLKIFMENSLGDSVKQMAGNCGEMAQYGLLYILKNEAGLKDVSIEVLEFKEPFDHVFIALGRNPATPLNDFRKWNKETRILDPWLGLSWSLDEFIAFWEKNFSLIHPKNSKNSMPDLKQLNEELKEEPKLESSYYIDPEIYKDIQEKIPDPKTFNLLALPKDLKTLIKENKEDKKDKDLKSKFCEYKKIMEEVLILTDLNHSEKLEELNFILEQVLKFISKNSDPKVGKKLQITFEKIHKDLCFKLHAQAKPNSPSMSS